MNLTFDIKCKFSGVFIGSLNYEVVAGHMPFLSHWNEMQAMHPSFSMPVGRLLAFSRGEFSRLLARVEDAEASPKEAESLCVLWLALLHSLGGIKQECVALPPLPVACATFEKLFALAFWRHRLDSKRFAFPEYKINRFNSTDRFDSVSYYLDACFDIRRSYEEGAKELEEREKIRAAEAAMHSLRSSWVRPTSKKMLWSWVRAHLPSRFEADAQGWMSTIFLGSARTILDFDFDEVQMLEDIIFGECPVGNIIFTAVKERLEEIKKVHTDRQEAFSIDLAPFQEVAAALQPEPLQKDFPTVAAFYKARAIWWLSQNANKRAGGI